MQDNRTPPERPDPSGPPPRPPFQPDDWRKWIWPGLLLFFLIWVIVSSGSFMAGNQDGSSVEVPFSRVRNEAADNIVFIEIDSSGITARGRFDEPVMVMLPDGRTLEATRFTTTLPPDGARILQDIFRTENTSALVEGNPPQSVPLLLQLLIQFSPILLVIAFLIWMSRRAQGQMGNVFGFGRSNAREYDSERPQVTFNDIAGQDAAKAELVEIVDFLRNPEKYIQLGARVPRGVLLVGPPGTGKTLMARAVAGEANCSFFSIAASEFVEMFVGVGASRVRDLFNRAQENSPSIVFIDEIDAVGRQRGAGLGGGNDEREQTLNQMLSELDGFEQDATVIVMAATNRPDVLDPALLRPGRFDRQVTVDLPDKKGRLEILQIHTRGKPLDPTVRLEDLAAATIGFSGADLANLANEAALSAARRNRKKILQEDFSLAFERIILGTERPPLSNQEERLVVAYHEAGHAVAAMLTPGADRVLKVTITPRGQALGITAFMPDDERRNYSRRYLEATLNVALGGRVAEELVFDDITTGASNDLRRVTDLARRMVAQFGMSSSIGPLNFGESDTQPFLGYTIAQGRTYSEETAARIDDEVRQIVDSAYHRTRDLLNNHRDKLDALAQALLAREVVERDEVLHLMGMAEKPLDTPEVDTPAPVTTTTHTATAGGHSDTPPEVSA
ncbi:MAG: ATP-dependent zinc metalloprotease FtsH [Anaerolineae bacterium]|jgi:cell division protease FtsH|nr:ATP-dependent zinc metalloprotease FtsH [Anaerolineae bacterium]